MIWGHAILSIVAFGTLTLFSSPVSFCLFPTVKSWIFVMSQLLGLIICSFIGMFWIRDPSLSIETAVYTISSDEKVIQQNRSQTIISNNSTSPISMQKTSNIASNSDNIDNI